MTQPLPGQRARTARDREAAGYEAATTEAATAGITALLAKLLQDLTVAYVRAAGGVHQSLPDDQQAGYRAAAVAALTALAGRTGTDAIREAARRLRTALPDGIRLGVRHAQQVTGPVDVNPEVPDDLAAAVGELAPKARADLAAAVRLAQAGRLDRYADVTALAGAAQRVTTRVERTARWAAVRAVNAGVEQVTEAAETSRIWIAERDACLTCLAYSGHVAGPGQRFPAGLTFGQTSTVTEPIGGPPAHPGCQCRAEAWIGSKSGFGIDLPTALKREAQRTVLAGTSGYASEPARVRAADRLLQVGTGLPMSVRDRARSAVRRGTFNPNR